MVTTFTSWFAHASFRKAMSSSRPKTSLPGWAISLQKFSPVPVLLGFVRYGVKIGRGHPQALTRDGALRVDRAYYHRHRLQQLGWVLKTANWIGFRSFDAERSEQPRTSIAGTVVPGQAAGPT